MNPIDRHAQVSHPKLFWFLKQIDVKRVSGMIKFLLEAV
jgi:hypothetical protein